MDDEAEVVLREFRESFEAGTPFPTDRELGAELVVEARPAVLAVCFALDTDSDFDLRRPEHGEGLALVTLLGRRAAALGASPTAASLLVPALRSGLRSVGRPLRAEDVTVLSSLCLEGYVAGREERTAHRSRELVAASQANVEIVPRIRLLVLAGEPDAEALQEVIEEFGRSLLKGDAVAAIVELTRLEGAAPDRAAEVFAADSTARLLGVRCLFVGVSDAWMTSAREARLDLDLVRVVRTMEEALHEALPLAGRVLRPTSWLPAPLKNILGRSE